MAKLLPNSQIIEFDNFSDKIKLVHERSGVYFIFYSKKGIAKGFRRLNGTDKEGILCIGKGKNLRKRIIQFYKDVKTPGLKVAYHSEGWNFRKYFKSPHNGIKLNIKNIKVKWKYTKNYDQYETRAIQKYVAKFQDKPPLNISIRRQRR